MQAAVQEINWKELKSGSNRLNQEDAMKNNGLVSAGVRRRWNLGISWWLELTGLYVGLDVGLGEGNKLRTPSSGPEKLDE